MSEAAVAAADHPIGSDELGQPQDAIGDQLGMLDDVGRVADQAGRQDTLPSGSSTSSQALDLELAFASLAPPVQRLAEHLTAVHDGSREFGLSPRRHGEGSLWEGETYRKLDPVEHPVVRVHPETRRRSLFVNPGFTSRLVGVSEAESRHLLDLF